MNPLAKPPNGQNPIGVELTPEVFVARSSVLGVSVGAVRELEAAASRNPRRISRLLLHQHRTDALHQMVIVHSRGQYIRPHKNERSAKSWQVVKGTLVFVRFAEDGSVVEWIAMSTPERGQAWIVRLSDSHYHTLIPTSPQSVVVETILGPFTGTAYAPWAPAEDGGPEAASYFARLCEHVGIDAVGQKPDAP